ncbi:hypothetical protein O181_028651 [Austropuccinia psidii MF-1]|uniref:Uncharacterized protein n=1 Tax=Austropuccinia psidii MF-1 TaxID=1389203 RepID=A0A9Q3H2K6_9BASI|nr:hypothetical protein [Austropuccinia psidii MF-1]
MLTQPHHPLDVTPTLPPHHSLCFNSPSAQNPYAPTPPLRYMSYASVKPPHPLLRLPSLCLNRFPQDIPPSPPSTLLMPPPTCLILFAAYHAYTWVVPSQHASDTAPPSPPSSLPTLPYPHCSQSLCSRGALKIFLLRRPQPSLCLLPPGSSSLLIAILTPTQFPANMPPMPPLHLCPHNSLHFHTSAASNPYSPAALSR